MQRNDLRVSFTTDDWKYVVSEIEKQLKNAREAIEQKSCTPEDTAHYRGRIALAKEILAYPLTVKMILEGGSQKTTR